MSSSRRLLIAALGLPLAGCYTIGSEDPGLGVAVKYNSAMQIINPNPVYPEGSAQPGENGDNGAQDVKRYRTDEVNQRHKTEVQSNRNSGLNTTQGVGGGSGGGGGGPH